MYRGFVGGIVSFWHRRCIGSVSRIVDLKEDESMNTKENQKKTGRHDDIPTKVSS